MFRYLGLAWDASEQARTLEAHQLAERLKGASGWNTALLQPGLQVFTAGARPGINSAYVLQGSRGVVLGRLFRRSDLDSPQADDIALTPQESEDIRESDGRALVRDFWGRYTAFLQTASGSVRVIRDPTGTLPCFRIRHEGVSIIFSWLEDALAMLPPSAIPRVNWDALQAHILFGGVGGRETALDGVDQIVPGERLDLDDDKSTLLWSAVDIAGSPSTVGAAEATDQLRRVVRSCTRAWASCYNTIVLRLSGGVDSSILASCLAPNDAHTDVICVIYHSEGSDSDERRYARLAATRAARDLIERERDPDFRIDRVLTIARMPTPVAYAGWMNAATDARLATAHAAPALFTGAGGDALFFEFARWWPAADYLHDRGLSSGFAAAAMDAARLGRVSVWHAIGRAISEWLRPDIRGRTMPAHANALLVPTALTPRWERARFVHPDLLRSMLPIGKHTQTAHLLHPIGYYDPFEQDSAPEIVNPLLSQPIQELCLKLPTYVLTQGGQGRALARRAFASDLPQDIVIRRSKGGMEEHVKAVLVANLDFARGMLMDGELARRGLLDRNKAEELLSGKPTTLAVPMGHVHALIGVEAWLARWAR